MDARVKAGWIEAPVPQSELEPEPESLIQKAGVRLPERHRHSQPAALHHCCWS